MNYAKRGFVCEEQFTHFSHKKNRAPAQKPYCLHYGKQRAAISFSLLLCFGSVGFCCFQISLLMTTGGLVKVRKKLKAALNYK